MKRIRWRLILPIVQVGLAIAMLFLAHAEEKEFYAQLGDFVAVWDYVPHWYMLLIILNFPARIASAPLASLVGLERPWSDGLFVTLIGIFWYLLGIALDRRQGSLPPSRVFVRRPLAIALHLCGFVVSFGLLAIIISTSVRGGSALGLVPLAGILLWCSGFAVYFGAKLVGKLRHMPA